jgi:hypothetical protein
LGRERAHGPIIPERGKARAAEHQGVDAVRLIRLVVVVADLVLGDDAAVEPGNDVVVSRVVVCRGQVNDQLRSKPSDIVRIRADRVDDRVICGGADPARVIDDAQRELGVRSRTDLRLKVGDDGIDGERRETFGKVGLCILDVGVEL